MKTNKIKYAKTYKEIHKIIQEITDLSYEKEEGESIEEYKQRIEALHSPFISQLEGTKLEWIVPDYSELDEEIRPDNLDEEVLFLNTSASPVKDLVNMVMRSISIKR